MSASQVPGSRPEPVNVVVTGAAGQIGYSLMFRLVAGATTGEIWGERQVNIRMLETPAGAEKAQGCVLELQDCAFPLLGEVTVHTDPMEAFKDADAAFLVGAKPRAAGEERADLLAANGSIFGPQGTAIGTVASPDIKVIVVGNPANTNAAIAAAAAKQANPAISERQFTALTRLDHNRALAQMAEALQVPVSSLQRMTIWGNHSTTQFPDIAELLVDGEAGVVETRVDAQWVSDTFIPRVANRGAEIIEVRGSSSAASAANAAIHHMRDWVQGTTGDDWVSVALPSSGEYGVPEGLVCSFPCRSVNGQWEVVEGLELSEQQRERIQASVAELQAEWDTVQQLGLV